MVIRNRGLTLGALVFGAAALAPIAQAHHRDFTFLRDWFLPFMGEKEMEYRFFHIKEGNFNKHEFEFEYGITDHFAIEPGFAFVKEGTDKLHLDEWDIELRFNFGKFEINKPLFALNVEYEHPTDPDEPTHGELKFIASMFNERGDDFSINVNVGRELSHGDEQEGEVAAGWVTNLSGNTKSAAHGYNLGPRGGLESTFDFQEHNWGLGPTLVYRANEHFNILGTFMFGINHPDIHRDELRIIAEWEF